jgi:hypothetical protein
MYSDALLLMAGEGRQPGQEKVFEYLATRRDKWTLP